MFFCGVQKAFFKFHFFLAPGSSVVRSSNDFVDFEEEDAFPSRLKPPSNTRALASTSKYRGNYFFVVFRKYFFNTLMIIQIIFPIFYLDDGIVNQLRQNEAGNRRPKVTSMSGGRILVV